MSLSPLDIEHASLERAPWGYRPRAVRALLERIAAEREELLHQQRRLRDDVAARDEEIASLREAEAELQRAVIAAERIATEMKENARRAAELIEAQARFEAQALRRSARGDVAAARAELARLERSQSLVREQIRGQLTAFLRTLDPEAHTAVGTSVAERGAPADHAPLDGDDDDWVIREEDLPDD